MTAEERIKTLEQEVQRLWGAVSKLHLQGISHEEPKDTPVTGEEAEPYIEQILFDLGMPPHCAGYMNIVAMTKTLVEHPEMTLRDACASSGTKGNAERNIRYAIEITWSRGDSKQQEAYFGKTIDPDRAKPTAQELLRTVAKVARRSVQEARLS